MTPPVLFLIFNRPDLVQHSFAKIRQAQPAQLFVAADGPRADREGEAELCGEARAIIDQVDWDCDVQTLFREQNFGCRAAVSSAITWFFEHVEEGIIMEDDCVADASFFPYCAELLDRYRDDERIMCITGNNFQRGQRRGKADYYFSIYNHCWGWASWRRAWRLYDSELTQWPKLKSEGFLNGFMAPEVALFWTGEFDAVENRKLDSWGYVWKFSCWANSGLTVTPCVNLVTNVGFDERATHTKDSNSISYRLQARPIGLPLVHPTNVVRDAVADRFTETAHFGIRELGLRPSLASRVRGRIRRDLATIMKSSPRRRAQEL
jgi:hypothetical protein